MKARSVLCLLLLLCGLWNSHQHGTSGKATGASGSNASQPNVGSSSVSSIDGNKTQRAMQARQHIDNSDVWRRQRRGRHPHACMCPSVCVAYTCTRLPVWVGSVWMPTQMRICVNAEIMHVYTWILENRCAYNHQGVSVCAQAALSTTATAPSTPTCCICSQGWLLPWTATWDFVFLKILFQYSQCQVHSMAYSRCSINICWTELDWIEFNWIELDSHSESLCICTRERKWICGMRVNVHALSVHGYRASLHVCTWVCLHAVNVRWHERIQTTRREHADVCVHTCLSMCARASSRALSCVQKTQRLPRFSRARFPPGKPGAAKISMKMVVFG